MASKILITGGTGLVGSYLTNELKKKNCQVNILTTSALKSEQPQHYFWNWKDGYIDHQAFEGVDYIIHLAGAGVADKPWTAKRKQEIERSRVVGTAVLRKHAKDHGVKGILAASAMGYYGMDTGNQELEESSQKGTGFLAEVVDKWESELHGFEEIVEQVTLFRIGVVLSTEGGALKKMMAPFKWGIGSPIGSGKQYMSWVHIEDLAQMFLYAMENNVSGTFNAVAPRPETNASFSKKLAKAMKKPYFMPNVPSFVLRILYGEMAQVILGGNKVKADKIIQAGYEFSYPTLDEALKDLIRD